MNLSVTFVRQTKLDSKMKKSSSLAFLLIVMIGFSSCKSDDGYDIPSSYNFENVSYTGQTSRISMLTEMKAYMATSQTQGVELNAEKLKAMFANEGAVFSTTYPKQIKSKTFESEQPVFEALMEELALASTSKEKGTFQNAGIIQSVDGAKSYLIGANGLEYAQLIEKGLMGACFYYQATSVYLGADRMNVDNDAIVVGEGTAMEHHWDEAFGYLGVPTDFPSNKESLAFWGSYSDKRNEVLNSNQIIMDALLKGRAAISNDDLEARDEAIDEVRAIWEKISVGSALHYLNDAVAEYEDQAIRFHALSEAIAFIYALKFNEGKIISNTQVNQLLTDLAGSNVFSEMNLYQTEVATIETVRDDLAVIYSLEDEKANF